MYRFNCPVVLVWPVLLIALSGCNSNKRQWEITVENKSDTPCSFFIALDDGGTNVKAEDVAKGQTHSLIVGDNKTVVQSVKVVRGQDEQTMSPNADLPVGKRYTIVVGADNKVDTSTADR